MDGHRVRRVVGWVAAAVLGSGWALASVGAARPGDKIHPRVAQDLARAGEAEFLIVLAEQADLTPAAATRDKTARGLAVHERLTEVARRTQAPLLAWLTERDVRHRPFWIVNMVWARAGPDTVAAIASRSEVKRLDANPRVPLVQPRDMEGSPRAISSIEWGILNTLADQVWALGYDGTGIVVGGQDTGYQWDHPALVGQYRGWDGASADHDYHWHDAIHSGGGVCGSDSSFPCDDHSHGTHTMGTAVGNDGAGNQIGMAPGATWIGCRNMDQGNGTPATYSECFEFFVAPTDLDGENPDPTRAPHVINNSWSCPESEGCSPETLQLVVENTRAAGIVVVVSAGNGGSGCSSIATPAAIYDAAFTIGATDVTDTIAQFSSRGPVTVDGSDRLKPDLAAPGVGVRSSVPGGGYAFASGTSLAAPHVAGAVALLLDARPDLIGDVESVEELIRRAALPRTSSQDCGGIPGSDVPNAVYGHGRLDALATLLDDADGDGVENLADCSPLDGQVWEAPGAATALELVENSLVTQLTWNAPPDGEGATRYDLLRSESPSDFSSPTCVTTNEDATATFDPDEPESIFYYLVRSRNDCGANAGVGSDGLPRTAAACPEFP